MKTNDIRSAFLDFFKSKAHTAVESSSLVPHNDPSLLFTNAGMVQFKDVFLGKDKRSYKRAASVQKCLRAGGKHNDLENVGFTARHHTFFEMLGNFSFGDYFKEEAIVLAWELSTKVFRMPVDRLYVTVYKDDDEAFKLWQKKIGLSEKRIFRMGEKDNFWSMGETGPCGPCSELFIDRGERYGCGKASCTVGCDCDRYMEYWNLVFMQFDRDSAGHLSPLPAPSIDTGSGLERVASILQNADSNYDIDIFREVISHTRKLLSAKMQAGLTTASEAPLRVIADHARAATFLVSDGVMPSNEGRGYVLRRIIRRAIRYGKKIGFDEPFLHRVCDLVIGQMAGAYPYLQSHQMLLKQCIFAEEEQFLRTLELGLNLLADETKKLISAGQKTIAGEVAFKLYDTYGFPVDLTKVIAAEQYLQVDEVGFSECMQSQKARSRKHWQGSGEESIEQVYHQVHDELEAAGQLPKFCGYEQLDVEAECVAVWPAEPGMVYAVFAQTPFYAEGGGQVSDQGRVTASGVVGEVVSVQKPVADLVVLKLKMQQGALFKGKKYHQSVHGEARFLTAKNHTATHLLHWALRSVLGEHVKQAGSLVNADMLRFDFTHFQALTSAESKKVEDLINAKIWLSDPVRKQLMGKDAAIKAGAIAFFGEKYGDEVRVISVGDYSVELCGGTHVNNSSEINLFKIVSEASIASGVRRIVAYTGKNAFIYLREREEESRWVRETFKATQFSDVESKVGKLQDDVKELRRKIADAQNANMGDEVETLLQKSINLNGIQAVIAMCADDGAGESAKKLRDLGDRIRQKNSRAVAIVGMKVEAENKAYLAVAVGKDILPKVNANTLLQQLTPLIAGRGGGKPDMAQAGGTDLAGLDMALTKAKEILAKI